ncbi:MAG TPA: LysR family transcriptional regulator ArgP [Paenirhodobacter sp.]
MIDYPAAQAVALIVQTGSFEAAARALSITPSAVSQRVRQLEDRLGTVLIRRGAPCTATEQGARLCRHIEQVGLLEGDLLQHLPGMFDPLSARVTLNIAVNADSLGSWFLPAVVAYTRHATPLLNIDIDDQDHTADWLRRGQVVAAVTAHDTAVQGCRLRSLGRLRYHATASPDYMRRHFPQGVTPAALAHAPALRFNQKDRLQQDWVRKVFAQMIELPTHWLPSTQSFVDGTLAGMGWGMNPAKLVEAHLADGRLVEMVPGTYLDTPLYWQVSKLAADRLAPLSDEVCKAAKRALIQDVQTS